MLPSHSKVCQCFVILYQIMDQSEKREGGVRVTGELFIIVHINADMYNLKLLDKYNSGNMLLFS